MDKDAGNSKAAVLVVEDEMLIRLWAADLLEENGFSVLEAENAEAALKVLESRPDVKLLFTDVQMPGSLNGMELAREVHARWPHVLLVITSGRERPAPAEIPDDGRFVAKPYSGEQLLGQINNLMNKSRIGRY
jgi:two-component system, response regulator PdtaR